MALVSILPPGNNEHSQVSISYCDEICQSTPICDNKATWHCNSPRLNKDIYKEKTEELINKGLSKDIAKENAKVLSYSRPETYEEGLARYYIIATAIEKVSGELSKNECLKENVNKAVCKDKPWYYDQRSLAMLVATLIIKESGLRSDVHGGMHSGLGDCHFHYRNGKYEEYCNSYGLGQVMQIALRAHHLDYNVKEIAGLDYISTEKSIRAVAYAMSGAKGICGYRYPKMDSVAGAFSLYGTGNNCKLKYLNDRSGMYYMILYSKKNITNDILEVMSGEKYKEVYDLLYNTKKQIHQLPSVKFETIELNKFFVKL